MRLAIMRALLLVAAFGVAAVAPAQEPGGFYDPGGLDLTAARPGQILRIAEMGGAPAGAAAYRLVYRSTSPEGRAVPVSGVIVVPPGPAPAQGRPVIAWAHPTSGVEPQCAPSLANGFFGQVQGLSGMLQAGYVVAATDYAGLGMPGPHPYLVGVSEARAVLDSVRAARALPQAEAGRHFAVWGHSQGGQAALFTGMAAQGYAPDLTLVGVAAAAPATELSRLLAADIETTGGRNLTAMTLWSWSQVYGAPLDKVVLPGAMPAVRQLAGDCIESIGDIFARLAPTRALSKSFLASDSFYETQPWRGLLARNTPGLMPRNVPLFLAQGTADDLVRPPVTQDYADRQCRAGRSVRMLWLPGVGHLFAARDSADQAISWIGARFAGAPVPNDCGATTNP
ncbi:lipase [Bosea sp. Root381]|uniref:lipase family protein n=1 Tax=Bosea sp. Root381 TaxID=1736524 RepID=UPI0007123D62|nr:lipase family protein [Bosea sp. Root381]KRE08020.1 lipase [Bosea sp. Root381]